MTLCPQGRQLCQACAGECLEPGLHGIEVTGWGMVDKGPGGVCWAVGRSCMTWDGTGIAVGWLHLSMPLYQVFVTLGY